MLATKNGLAFYREPVLEARTDDSPLISCNKGLGGVSHDFIESQALLLFMTLTSDFRSFQSQHSSSALVLRVLGRLERALAPTQPDQAAAYSLSIPIKIFATDRLEAF